MKIEKVIWLLVPAVVNVFLLFKTTTISMRQKTFISWLLTIFIWLGVVFSMIMLSNIYFNDAWPSFLPHILIALSLFFLLLQLALKRKPKSIELPNKNVSQS